MKLFILINCSTSIYGNDELFRRATCLEFVSLKKLFNMCYIYVPKFGFNVILQLLEGKIRNSLENLGACGMNYALSL